MAGHIPRGSALSDFRLLALVAAALFGAGAVAAADEVKRSNWAPNVGELTTGEQPSGDMWTFRCPQGGSVSAAVDTKDDTDNGQSDIDPVLLIFDGQGNLIEFADDDDVCTYPPVCGFGCPSLQAECGQVGRHSIVVRDFGSALVTGDPAAGACQEGGGYELTLEVLGADGQPLSEQQVKLGGGPRKSLPVPGWARELGRAPVGPALDDEEVPQGVRSDKATCIVIGPGSTTCEASTAVTP